MKLRYHNKPTRNELHRLSKKGLVYFGMPYSSDNEQVLRYRGLMSEEITAAALDDGLQVFNPIAMTYRADRLRSHSDGSFKFYEQLDNRYIDLSSCLVICGLNGWWQSKGLTHERARFEKQGKAVFYLDVDNGIISIMTHSNWIQNLYWRVTKW